MAHYLMELYSPKQRWLDLDAGARIAYFDAVGAGMGGLASAGIEVVAMGETDAAVSQAASQRYFAVWRLPNAELVQTLVSAIAATGWHDYFDTINAAGQSVAFATHVEQLCAAR
jgi:hypothetical protein